MDLQDVILSRRSGARRGPPPPRPVARGGGPLHRSRATQDVLDAAMDDYWKADDADPAPVPGVTSHERSMDFGPI